MIKLKSLTNFSIYHVNKFLYSKVKSSIQVTNISISNKEYIINKHANEEQLTKSNNIELKLNIDDQIKRKIQFITIAHFIPLIFTSTSVLLYYQSFWLLIGPSMYAISYNDIRNFMDKRILNSIYLNTFTNIILSTTSLFVATIINSGTDLISLISPFQISVLIVINCVKLYFDYSNKNISIKNNTSNNSYINIKLLNHISIIIKLFALLCLLKIKDVYEEYKLLSQDKEDIMFIDKSLISKNIVFKSELEFLTNQLS